MLSKGHFHYCSCYFFLYYCCYLFALFLLFPSGVVGGAEVVDGVEVIIVVDGGIEMVVDGVGVVVDGAGVMVDTDGQQ